jgi:hypothetical protein
MNRVGKAARVFLVALPGFASFFSCAGAGEGGRDVVPETRDVIADGGSRVATDEGYEYIARRPLAVVALAEARGIDLVTARAATDHLADRLDTCVTEESRKGTPVEGAARVIAQIDPQGNVAATGVRVDPGTGGAASAVVCLVAPMKLLTFAPIDPTAPAGANANRGIAVEAIWGRVAPTAGAP